MRPLLHLLRSLGRLLAAGLAASSLLLLLGVGIGPRTGTYRVVTVLTGSMRPGMPEGSIVVSTPTAVDRLRVGDVITYRIPVEDRRVVTHRIIEIPEPGVVRTQGDGNNAPDTWLAQLKGQQVWQARADVPKLGYALERLRHPATSRLLVLAMPLLLAVLWLRDIWGTDGEAEAGPAPVPAPAAPQPRLRSTVALAALLSLGAACTRGRA